MRWLQSSILVLTFLGCTMLFFLPGSIFADSFKVNVSQRDVNWEHRILTLRDLGIGEYAYLLVPIFCREQNGEIKLLKDNKPYRDMDNDLTSYKVTRLPNDQFSIEIRPSRPYLSKIAKEEFIEKIVDKESTLTCNGYNLLFGTSPEDWLTVSSVDGTQSVKELMRRIK